MRPTGAGRWLLGDGRKTRMDESSRCIEWPAASVVTQYHAVDIRPATCLGNALQRVFAFSCRLGDRFPAPQLYALRGDGAGAAASPSRRPFLGTGGSFFRSIVTEADVPWRGDGQRPLGNLSQPEASRQLPEVRSQSKLRVVSRRPHLLMAKKKGK